MFITFIVYVPSPPLKYRLHKGGGQSEHLELLCLWFGHSPPTWQTSTHMSFKFLLQCHLLGEAFATVPSAAVIAPPTPGTPQAISRTLDFVSRAVGAFLEESW